MQNHSCIQIGMSLKKISYILLLTIFHDCSSGSSKSADTHSADTDSTALPPVVETIAELPDTMYESAKKVKFNIERTDTTSDGHISSLTDLYATAPGTFTFRQGPLRQADFEG